MAEEDSVKSQRSDLQFTRRPVPFGVSLMAGGIAGTAVDIILFPLDTIKTRMQSAEGFFKAGGFRSMYSGVGSAAAGSAPAAATFFSCYELTKNILCPRVSVYYLPGVYMASAVVGEVASLVVRLPFEVVKQRAQAYTNMTSMQALKHTITEEMTWSNYQGSRVDAWQSSICGAIAGGVAAGVTTPLDVAKTRIILAQKGDPEAKIGVYRVLLLVHRQQGVRGLFAGVSMRVTWIALGGAVFFGFYDKAKNVLMSALHNSYLDGS